MKYFVFIFLTSTFLFSTAQAMDYTGESGQVHLTRSPSPTPNNPAQFERWLKKAFAHLDDIEYFKGCMQEIIEKTNVPGFFEIYKQFILDHGWGYLAKSSKFIHKQNQWDNKFLLYLYLDPAFIPFLAKGYAETIIKQTEEDNL